MIYHYCAANVFSSIISTKEVWLTDITKLNDTSEYSTGYDLISEVLMSKGLHENEFLGDIRGPQLNAELQILIGCFSQEGDSGSQWRLYADDCHGLSIGFHEGDLLQFNRFNRFTQNDFQPISSTVKLCRIEYDQDAFVKKVPDFIELYERNNPILKYQMMAVALRRYAALYKNPFFKDEREIRAMIEIDPSVDDKYAVGLRTNVYNEQASYHKLLTSYQSLNAIKEVIVGPLCPQSIEQVQAVLASNGLPDVQVTYSSGRGRYRAVTKRETS